MECSRSYLGVKAVVRVLRGKRCGSLLVPPFVLGRNQIECIQTYILTPNFSHHARVCHTWEDEDPVAGNLLLREKNLFSAFFFVPLNRLTCTFVSHHPGNYYGTPKPPAEPSPVQPDLVDQVLFDEEFDTEVQRKRTTSVSKMDRKDSAAPDEEEEEEKPPMVNGLAGNYRTGFP